MFQGEARTHTRTLTFTRTCLHSHTTHTYTQYTHTYTHSTHTHTHLHSHTTYTPTHRRTHLHSHSARTQHAHTSTHVLPRRGGSRVTHAHPVHPRRKCKLWGTGNRLSPRVPHAGSDPTRDRLDPTHHHLDLPQNTPLNDKTAIYQVKTDPILARRGVFFCVSIRSVSRQPFDVGYDCLTFFRLTALRGGNKRG